MDELTLNTQASTSRGLLIVIVMSAADNSNITSIIDGTIDE